MLYIFVFFIGRSLCTTIATQYLKDSGVDRVLQILKDTLKSPKYVPNQKEYLENINDSINIKNENMGQFGSFKSKEIINLIKRGSEDINYHGNSEAKSQNHYSRLEDYLSNKNNEKPMNKLLSHAYNIKNELNNKLLIPNRLLATGSEIEKSVKHKVVGNLDDYTKIYIILNPRVIQRSRDKNAINELLSKILSISSSTYSQRDREEIGLEGRYKGFPVKKDILSLRRARRDSREMLTSKDSEDDYKQKRNRNEYGGGGGGTRTAIPYIRQRGDIYEKDD